VGGSSPWKSSRVHLEPGLHVVPFAFRQNEIGGPYAFWDTTFVGGVAMARLDYLASEQDLLDVVGGNAVFEEYLREQHEDGRVDTTHTLPRSIGTLEVRFERRASPIAVAPEPPREYQLPFGSPDAIDLSVSRVDRSGSTVYRYSLRNLSRESLFGFMVGAVRSSPSCPELQSVPIGFVPDRVECPPSIVIRRKWRGCVGRREDCGGHFLNLGYPDGEGLVPGGTLTFTVELPAPDPTYESASIWILGERNQYEGRVRSGSGDQGP
ncbi:MAG TPA: hypothetical protein VFP10_00430, partial [Candidatus Eisenbacteria bacterium]|nr:hypothetical protein [Candidatus Eisenbacteria bacterium]